jgi:hypothetical protein
MTLDKHHNFRSQGKKGSFFKFLVTRQGEFSTLPAAKQSPQIFLHMKYQQFSPFNKLLIIKALFKQETYNGIK